MSFEKTSVNPSHTKQPKEPETNSKEQDDSKNRGEEKSHSSSRHHRHRDRSPSHSRHHSRHRSRHSRHKSKHHSKHHSRHRSRHRDRNSSKSSRKSSPSSSSKSGNKANLDHASADLGNSQSDPSGAKPTTMLQSKYERELYVGNLPPGLTNNQLLELLNRALIRMGAVTEPGGPIINAWIGSDGRYAFVVFRSVEETNLALSLKGVSLMGYQIKVSKINMNARPNYNGVAPAGSLSTTSSLSVYI